MFDQATQSRFCASNIYIPARFSRSARFKVIRWPIGLPLRNACTRSVMGPSGRATTLLYLGENWSGIVSSVV